MCLWAWCGLAPDVLFHATAVLCWDWKSPALTVFFPRMVHSLARAFVVCTSLNCYRNILLSLIISLQFDLHFLSVLSTAVWFSNSSILVFQMFLLHVEFTTAVLLLFPPSPFILIYSFFFFPSCTALFSSDPSIVVFNSSLWYYMKKLGLWKWSSSAVGL